MIVLLYFFLGFMSYYMLSIFSFKMDSLRLVISHICPVLELRFTIFILFLPMTYDFFECIRFIEHSTDAP